MLPAGPRLRHLFTLFLLGATHLAIAQIPSAWVMGSNGVGQLGTNTPVNPSAPVVIDVEVASVAVGEQHTLYLKTDGSLWAIGANSDGQLGVGDSLDHDEPVQIATGVSAIAAGRAHSLFLKTDGTLWAAGDNTFGQLGVGDTLDRDEPAQIATEVATVAAGDDHTLFIKTDGSLWTTGRNTDGQLGDTTTTDRVAPVQVVTSVSRIAAGAAHTLFVKTNGSLWACGQGTFGQLGTGASNLPIQATPVQIVATGVTAIAAGASHSLFVKTDGTAWATGDNSFGQFGTGVTNRAYSPVQIATNIGTVAAGALHSLLLKTDGSVRASGDNLLRQLGGATGAPVLASVQLATGAVSVAAGKYQTAWISSGGILHALGDNSAGQLGSAATGQPIPLTVGADIAAISSGVSHTLQLKTDGTLWAVGDNTYGQLGVGDTLPRTTPVQIATGVAAASAGSFHTLYLKTDGTLWATGRNDRGQLGNNSTTHRSTAVQIATGVRAISAGGSHSLFTKTDDTLWGMGDNSYRQLGVSGSTSPNSIPMVIFPGVTTFAAGGAHSLFIISSGTLYATGNNDWGQLGTGTTFPTPPSSQLLVIATGVTTVSSAYDHTLFLKTDGTLWGMGRNDAGELGLGDTVRRLSPVQIATDVAAIATGGLGQGRGAGHSLFAKTDGSLWAMGDNRFGQLGDGSRLERLAPVQLPGAAHVVAVAAGDLTGAFVQAAPVAPTIATQPLSQEIEYGAYAHIRVTAKGGFLAHQWFRGASGDTTQPVVGATTAHLLTLPVTEPVSHWVRVTNSVGSIDSATVTITPRARPDAMLSGSGSRTRGALGNSVAPFRVAVPIPLAADIASLAHGSGHTLILKKDGTLWALGQNSGGPLGTGDTTARTTPVQIATSVAACAVGSAHSLFLKTDGTLWGMGDNTSGQLGDGTTTIRTSPQQIATAVRAFAAGSSHSLFLKTDDTLWGTGNNRSGQLGDTTTTNRSTPVQIADSVAAIAAGVSHSLFLKTNGDLWSTGANASGQLGDGTTTNRSTPVLVATGIAALSANNAGNHSLLLKTDGTLLGMGANASGRLGLGDTTDRTTPTVIDTGVIACSAGADHSLWIKSDHSLWGTGDNDFGQLGIGVAPDQLLPREIASGVAEARATAYSSWFVTTDDTLRGMGRTHAGQLAPAGSPFTTPVALADSVASIDVAVSGNWPESRSVAISGQVWSSLGQPADGLAAPGIAATDAMRVLPTPIAMSPGGDVEGSLGPERLLFLRADGTLWGSGDNNTGALGTGDTTPRTEPVQIAADVADAAMTGYGTTFLKNDGTLWTTGQARSTGGSQYSFGLSPVQIDTDVVALASSFYHVLYLKSDGSLWGFGDGGYRQLGVATSLGAVISSPVRIATEVARFAAGQRHTLFVKTDGTLWVCGVPVFGQLGLYISSLSLPLTQVTTGVADVVTTAETSFILKTDGTVWATGTNTHSRLGLPGSTQRTAFTQLRTFSPNLPFTGVAKIIPALSGENTFFLKTDGSLWGAGRNDLGQLGLGHTNVVSIPTLIRAQAYDVAGSGLHTLFLHDPVAIATPSIVAHPASQTAAFGDFATLTVGVSSGELLTYQWYEGASGDTSRPVAGATDATLRLPAFAGTASYWVRVTNLGGSADSSAATITVAGAGSPAFRSWAEAAGLRGSRLALSADADGDGLANLLEYAFRTAPDQAGDRATPTSELLDTPEGDFLVLTHRRRKDAPPTFAYEASADLLTWENQTLTPVLVDPDADGDGLVEEVSVALPLDPAEPRSFLRVRVSEP